MRKHFTEGQALQVSNGHETISVAVERVSGRKILVSGGTYEDRNMICGWLKYYTARGTYGVSKGGTNGRYPATYWLV